MKKNIPVEFMFQMFSLILAIIIVHAIYVSVIRPTATAIETQERAQLEADSSYVPKRSVYVIIQDFEQEACFILMIWAMALMGYKAFQTTRERILLNDDLIHVAEGMSILPEDTREYARPIQALPGQVQSLLVPRALLMALNRFRSTRNIQDVATAVNSVCDGETEKLDTELSMIRYLAWAIPSIGFIGTVRGIGQALALAHQAVEGDITGVTANLGIAFNSTFIALLISIVLMFLLHQLQETQEHLVFETKNYVDDRLVRHMQIR